MKRVRQATRRGNAADHLRHPEPVSRWPPHRVCDPAAVSDARSQSFRFAQRSPEPPRLREACQLMPRSSAVALTAAAWGFGSAITCLIIGSPFLLFGYHEPSLTLVLNPVDPCRALLVAYLLLGAFLRSRRLQDELLAQGFLLLALAGVVGMILPQSVPAFSAPATLEVWLPLTLRVSGAILVVTAALVGGRTASWHRSWWRQPVPWVLAVLVMVLLVARDWLPVALSQSAPSLAGQPVIDGHPMLLAAQGLSALCFFVASVVYTLQARRRPGELLRWLGPACALAGFARVNYVLFS